MSTVDRADKHADLVLASQGKSILWKKKNPNKK